MMGYSRTHFSAAPAAVANRFVTSTNMKVGAYSLANAGAMPSVGARHVTVTHTTATITPDTLGTITISGKSLLGQTISESITPVAGTTVTGTLWFASIDAPVGVGWVIDAVEGVADTITVGCGAACAVVEATGTLWGVIVNTTAAGTITLADASGTIAVLKASIAEGFFLYNVEFNGFLTVAMGANSDITLVHSGSRPTSYSM